MASRSRARSLLVVLWLAALILIGSAPAAADPPVLAADARGVWCVDAAMRTRALRTSGLSSTVHGHGGVWFVADGRNGLVTVGLSNGRPVQLDRLAFDDAYVHDVAVGEDGYAWVTSEQGVAAVDASQASALRLAGAFSDDPVLRAAHGVATHASVLWVAAQHTLRTYSVRAPSRPRLLNELRLDAQDVRALRHVAGALLVEFVVAHSENHTSVIDVRSPEHPVAFESDLPGRVFEDEGRLYLATTEAGSTRVARLELDLARRAVSREVVLEVPATGRVLGVAGSLAFVSRVPRGIEVLDMTTARLVGAIRWDFATGSSRIAREGTVVALATRFGGTQFFDLREFSPQAGVRRFAGVQVTLSPEHGDFFSHRVRSGESVSSVLAEHHILEAGSAWRAQMARFARLNWGVANADVIRPGQSVLVPIPDRVFCREAPSASRP